MPGAATITAFQGQTPPWSLISLDANFTAQNALLKDVGNYSTYIADAGGANAYSCTYGASLTFSLATGVKVVFKAANANTGASTLNVNATGIKNILNVDGSALTANQIVAGGIYTAVYDGTQYQLLNPTSGIVAGNSTITGNLVVKGNTTLGDAAGDSITFTGTVTSDLLFTDATYDIGKSGATRPRDGFFSRNVAIGGTLGVTGVAGVINGVSLNPWSLAAGTSGAQVHDHGAIWADINSVYFEANAYNNAGEKYAKANGAARVHTDASAIAIKFATAAVGVSGNAITWLEQVRVTHTASASRYLTLTGSNGGNPTIGTSAGDLAVSANIAANSAATSTKLAVTQSGAKSAWFGVDSSSGAFAGSATADKFTLLINQGEVGQLNASGYFKASNSGAYIDGATALSHEMVGSGALNVLRVSSIHATTPFGANVTYNNAAPNGTGNEFLFCQDNAATRATLRSNGGLANFQANNVNLCSLSVKTDFTPLADVPGMLDRMWEAHRELDWAQYRYKDQTHEEFNYGPSAERVHELFTQRGIPLTDAWQPEKMHTGAVTIGGLSYDYAVRGDNPDSPLGITGDFAYVTGAMVSYAQKRIERIEAALVKAKLL